MNCVAMMKEVRWWVCRSLGAGRIRQSAVSVERRARQELEKPHTTHLKDEVSTGTYATIRSCVVDTNMIAISKDHRSSSQLSKHWKRGAEFPSPHFAARGPSLLLQHHAQHREVSLGI
jgi:hypothetical protein